MLIQRQRGFTLLELMIGLVIIAMLLLMGIPAFSIWIQNTQNRSAAESMLNGLQLARAESVRRNAIVRFNLTDASGVVAWNVGCVTVTASCPATIQSRPAAEANGKARVGISTVTIPVPAPAGHFATPIAIGTELPAGVSFNGLGRVPNANVGDDITRIDVTTNGVTSGKRYVVIIGTGGQIRMCDPALVFSANPQGCS